MDDIQMARTKRCLRGTVTANELTIGAGQCKLIRDFLDHYDLPWQALHMPLALPHARWRELNTCMTVLYEKIKRERDRLCGEYGVACEDELPRERRQLFDAALRAFVKREDHYYVEQGAGE